MVGARGPGGAASAAATLAELGYRVKNFVFHDSPRRAHSIAAQGGINAAKNYQNDGDSVHRLFYDTLKGGDYRSPAKPTPIWLAEVSANIIDQCVAQGVPFAREYGGLLAPTALLAAHRFSRTFYALKGQTGQQLLLGALFRAFAHGGSGRTIGALHPQRDARPRGRGQKPRQGIIARNLRNRRNHRRTAGDAVLLATGGYGNVFNLSTYARAPTRRRSGGPTSGAPASPTRAIPRFIRPASRSPATIQSKLDADVRVPAQRRPHLGAEARRTARKDPNGISDSGSRLLSRADVSGLRQPLPRLMSLRARPSAVCDEGGGGESGLASYLDFKDASRRA